jgi:phosphoglycolate phosphatase
MLILFDIDGTLLNTNGSGRESTRRAMREVFGTESTIDTHYFGGKTDWFTLIELLGRHGFDADAIGDRMSVYEESIARHLNEVIAERGATAYPGAIDVVQALKDRPGVLLGIVTGNVSATAPVKLRAAGFDPAWFPVGAYGSEAIERDHLPGLALKRAIDHAKRDWQPHEVIVIGDTTADIQCARAAGAKAIAVCTGFCPREELEAAKPDILLDDLTGLLDVLELPANS